ncbi:MAG TPA: TetR/AcrR family transcriptional regulator [Pseudonocardia sp.]|nr:TetR/AcrR family transcriptional regulator [Pseudonocardia sp.]
MDTADRTTYEVSTSDETAASGGSDGGASSPTKRQPTPRMLRKRARTREHVLEVAEGIYADSGNREPRMEDLADAANVSIGLIYDHFGSKDGVGLALAERALDGLSDYLDQAGEHVGSPMQRVMVVGELYLRWILEHPSVLRSVVLQGLDGQPARADQVDEQVGAPMEAILAKFQNLIEQAMARGEADDTFDPLLTARFLWASWNGVAALIARSDRMAFDRDQLAACLRLGRRLVNEGLTAPTFRDEQGQSRATLVEP